MVWSPLRSFGGSHKLPRKFYVNRRPLFGKSGAGTVETTLPFGNAYPLPTTSYLFGVCSNAGTVPTSGWCVGGKPTPCRLEGRVEGRVVMGAISRGALHSWVRTWSSRQGCWLSLFCASALPHASRWCQLLCDAAAGWLGRSKESLLSFYDHCSQAVKSRLTLVGSRPPKRCQLCHNSSDFQGPTPGSLIAATLPHVSDGRAF